MPRNYQDFEPSLPQSLVRIFNKDAVKKASVYDFKRAIEDNATLPLKYINRGEKLAIENPYIDDEMTEILENEDIDDNQKRKLTYLFQRNYVVLTVESRLDAIAKDYP